jgi:hypothetical protein
MTSHPVSRTTRRNRLAVAALLICLPLSSCELIKKHPEFAVIVAALVITYIATQQQQKLAQQSVARRPTQVRKAQTKYVAVAVPKKDGGKGKDMIIVDKETKKPVNNKAYQLKPGQTAKAGQKMKLGGVGPIGGYEVTPLDTVHGY